jgi:hypothetical protein
MRSYFFSALSSLVHLRESLHRISSESLLPEKLFGKAFPRFNLEADFGALPNRTLDTFTKDKGHRAALLLDESRVSY